MVRRHVEYTGSTRGQYVLDNWDRLAERFVKIMPIDYKRALAELQRAMEETDENRRCGLRRRRQRWQWRRSGNVQAPKPMPPLCTR